MANRGAYVAAHSDASAYIASGELWRRGELARPVPLQLWATWPNAADSGSPLGFRPGPQSGFEVPAYPAGLPIVFAAATRLAGPMAAYLVAPFFAACFVWTGFLLARRLGGDCAAIFAAVLLGCNPIVIFHGVHAMSDIPAAAAWMGALAFALECSLGAAAASGALVALAVMIRPNLAPLAFVPAALLVLGRRPGDVGPSRRRALAIFVAFLLPGALVVVWSQSVLYGGATTPPYPGWQSFFAWSNVKVNVTTYPALFRDVFGSGVLLAALAPFVAYQRRLPWDAPRILLALALVVLINAGLYVAYLPYDHWPFLRFFLPAVFSILVSYAAVLGHALEWFWRRPGWQIAAAVPVLLACQAGTYRMDLVRYSLDDWRARQPTLQAGRYLALALPQNAVALSFIESGSLAFYTGRNVVRLDQVTGTDLDRVVTDLTRSGLRPAIILDEAIEGQLYRDRFKSARIGALDWRPRAQFVGPSRVIYWLVEDRDRSLAGETWPIDVIR